MLRSVDGQYRRQAELSANTARLLLKLWRRIGPDFSRDFERVAPRMLDVLESGRAAAVVQALPYTAAALGEQRVEAPRVAELSGARFMASAPSGAPIADVLEAPIIRVRTLVDKGIPVPSAFERGGKLLVGIALTVMADTRRSVYGADIISRPAVGGFVRMLTPPSCKDCVLLAGRFYRWNTGFLRHPRCDCTHVPVARKNQSDSLLTDPYEYFNSLSKEQQERVFGRLEARAIRDGGDISRVVNVKNRGLSTAIGRGKTRQYATMTVDDIYRVAGTRTNAIRMLEEQGYIKGPQVLRQAPERFSTPISRPIIAGSNRDRVLTARQTGIRDPLDTATMTAAERRLYDSWYRLNYAEVRGGIARSTTGQLSSSDALLGDRAASSVQVAQFRRELDDEFARQFGGTRVPESVTYLAQLLGLI